MPVEINKETCTGCKSCEEVCPTEAVKVDDKGIAVSDAEKCIDCGACVDACVNNSITVK